MILFRKSYTYPLKISILSKENIAELNYSQKTRVGEFTVEVSDFIFSKIFKDFIISEKGKIL